MRTPLVLQPPCRFHPTHNTHNTQHTTHTRPRFCNECIEGVIACGRSLCPLCRSPVSRRELVSGITEEAADAEKREAEAAAAAAAEGE